MIRALRAATRIQRSAWTEIDGEDGAVVHRFSPSAKVSASFSCGLTIVHHGGAHRQQ